MSAPKGTCMIQAPYYKPETWRILGASEQCPICKCFDQHDRGCPYPPNNAIEKAKANQWQRSGAG